MMYRKKHFDIYTGDIVTGTESNRWVIESIHSSWTSPQARAVRCAH